MGVRLCVCAALLFVLWPGGASVSQAQSGGWDADDRVMITDFSVVTALARSSNRLFAATNGGLVIVDEAFDAFELPVTVEDGYPTSLVTALAYDHRDDSLWMASGGEVIQLDPFSRRFRDRIIVGQPVDELIPANGGGSDLFVRAGRRWWRLDTFTRDLSRADAGEVRAAIETRSDLRRRWEALQDGFFRDALDRVARNWDGRPLRVTDVMPGRQPYVWWVGTVGGFLFDYDDGSRDGSRRAYGPSGEGMAAVTTSGDAVWFAPRSPRDGRYGVAVASDDLQSWRVWRADSSSAVPSEVRALLSSSRGTWAGGKSGLLWLEKGGTRWAEQRAIDLGVQPVLTLAAASGPGDGSVWVGTSRGLMRLTAPGGTTDILVLPADAITAVTEANGVVWIGTGHGLYAMDLSHPDTAPSASGVAGPMALRAPVGAIAAMGNTVFAGLDREVWSQFGSDAGWERVDAVGRQRGPVTSLAVSEGTLWVGSTDELTAWTIGGAEVKSFVFGSDLPADARGRTGVFGIAPVSGGTVWLALPAGALRFETGF